MSNEMNPVLRPFHILKQKRGDEIYYQMVFRDFICGWMDQRGFELFVGDLMRLIAGNAQQDAVRFPQFFADWDDDNENAIWRMFSSYGAIREPDFPSEIET